MLFIFSPLSIKCAEGTLESSRVEPQRPLMLSGPSRTSLLAPGTTCPLLTRVASLSPMPLPPEMWNGDAQQ